MLAAERANFNRDIAALQAKCAEAEAKVSEARSNSERLQNAANAADQKVSRLGKELKDKVCVCLASRNSTPPGVSDVFFVVRSRVIRSGRGYAQLLVILVS